MTIKLRKVSTNQNNSRREFIGRNEELKFFWNNYKKVSEKNIIKVLSYYGTGGVGKTRLLNKLMQELDRRNRLLQNKISCNYIYYDFDNNFDMRAILQTLKTQLSAYGCEFPLFDTGDFLYALKIGKSDINPPKAKSLIDKSQYLCKIKPHFDKIGGGLDAIFSGVGLRALPEVINFIDRYLAEYLENNKILDDVHKEIKSQLFNRRQAPNPNELYEYLPVLFAQDVRDWIEATGSNLVVFLDSYEVLVNEVNAQRKRDLWLRNASGGIDGIIFLIPNTLWVIAGRSKLRWGAEFDYDLEQHLMKPFNHDEADTFLQKTGVDNIGLRNEIIELTKGLPIFLNFCADTYDEYMRNHESIPDIAQFKSKRQDVFDELVKYMSAEIQDMIKFLCVLNMWTDNIAKEIGKNAMSNFSGTIYEQTKNFSFIQNKLIQKDEFDVNLFTFDRTVQSILFPNCDEFIRTKTLDAANKYFADTLKHLDNVDDKFCFLLNMWSKLLVRLASDDTDLKCQYETHVKNNVQMLIDSAKFSVAENIINLFFDKISNNDLNYAYFERELSLVKNAQGKYKEAYDYINASNDKYINVLGQQAVQTIDTIYQKSKVLIKLGRYNDALDLLEQVFNFRLEHLGSNSPEMLDVMSTTAATLNYLGEYKDALKLQKKVLVKRQKLLGEEHLDTISAMNNLAFTLNALGEYDEARKYQVSVLELRKKILGELHPDTIRAKNNFASTLYNVGYYEEARRLKEEVLNQQINILGSKHPDTMATMQSLANTLNALKRYEDAFNLQNRVFNLCKEIFGLKHPNTIKVMSNIASTYTYMKNYDEALKLQEKVLSLRQDIFEEVHPDCISSMYQIAKTLHKLKRNDESLKMIEKSLTLVKDNNSPIIDELKNLNKLIAGK